MAQLSVDNEKEIFEVVFVYMSLTHLLKQLCAAKQNSGKWMTGTQAWVCLYTNEEC
jgi:hypothetical protein